MVPLHHLEHIWRHHIQFRHPWESWNIFQQERVSEYVILGLVKLAHVYRIEVLEVAGARFVRVEGVLEQFSLGERAIGADMLWLIIFSDLWITWSDLTNSILIHYDIIGDIIDIESAVTLLLAGVSLRAWSIIILRLLLTLHFSVVYFRSVAPVKSHRNDRVVLRLWDEGALLWSFNRTELGGKGCKGSERRWVLGFLVVLIVFHFLVLLVEKI